MILASCQKLLSIKLIVKIKCNNFILYDKVNETNWENYYFLNNFLTGRKNRILHLSNKLTHYYERETNQ